MQGLLWHHYSSSQADRLIRLLWTMFPGADEPSAVWRMTFFSSFYNLEIYQSVTGFVTNEHDAMYLDDTNNPMTYDKNEYRKRMSDVFHAGERNSLKKMFETYRFWSSSKIRGDSISFKDEMPFEWNVEPRLHINKDLTPSEDGQPKLRLIPEDSLDLAICSNPKHI